MQRGDPVALPDREPGDAEPVDGEPVGQHVRRRHARAGRPPAAAPRRWRRACRAGRTPRARRPRPTTPPRGAGPGRRRRSRAFSVSSLESASPGTMPGLARTAGCRPRRPAGRRRRRGRPRRPRRSARCRAGAARARSRRARRRAGPWPLEAARLTRSHRHLASGTLSKASVPSTAAEARQRPHQREHLADDEVVVDELALRARTRSRPRGTCARWSRPSGRGCRPSRRRAPRDRAGGPVAVAGHRAGAVDAGRLVLDVAVSSTASPLTEIRPWSSQQTMVSPSTPITRFTR